MLLNDGLQVYSVLACMLTEFIVLKDKETCYYVDKVYIVIMIFVKSLQNMINDILFTDEERYCNHYFIIFGISTIIITVAKKIAWITRDEINDCFGLPLQDSSSCSSMTVYVFAESCVL